MCPSGRMGNSAGFAPYPLWLASYGVSKPAVVGGWKSYTFWQYTETGKLAGAGPKTDLSVFNGSLAQLEAMTTTAASPAAAAAGPAAAAAAADAMTLKYTTRGTTKPADATRGAVTSSRRRRRQQQQQRGNTAFRACSGDPDAEAVGNCPGRGLQAAAPRLLAAGFRGTTRSGARRGTA